MSISFASAPESRYIPSSKYIQSSSTVSLPEVKEESALISVADKAPQAAQTSLLGRIQPMPKDTPPLDDSRREKVEVRMEAFREEPIETTVSIPTGMRMELRRMPRRDADSARHADTAEVRSEPPSEEPVREQISDLGGERDRVEDDGRASEGPPSAVYAQEEEGAGVISTAEFVESPTPGAPRSDKPNPSFTQGAREPSSDKPSVDVGTSSKQEMVAAGHEIFFGSPAGTKAHMKEAQGPRSTLSSEGEIRSKNQEKSSFVPTNSSSSSSTKETYGRTGGNLPQQTDPTSQTCKEYASSPRLGMGRSSLPANNLPSTIYKEGNSGAFSGTSTEKEMSSQARRDAATSPQMARSQKETDSFANMNTPSASHRPDAFAMKASFAHLGSGSMGNGTTADTASAAARSSQTAGTTTTTTQSSSGASSSRGGISPVTGTATVQVKGAASLAPSGPSSGKAVVDAVSGSGKASPSSSAAVVPVPVNVPFQQGAVGSAEKVARKESEESGDPAPFEYLFNTHSSDRDTVVAGSTPLPFNGTAISHGSCIEQVDETTFILHASGEYSVGFVGISSRNEPSGGVQLQYNGNLIGPSMYPICEGGHVFVQTVIHVLSAPSKLQILSTAGGAAFAAGTASTITIWKL